MNTFQERMYKPNKSPTQPNQQMFMAQLQPAINPIHKTSPTEDKLSTLYTLKPTASQAPKLPKLSSLTIRPLEKFQKAVK